MKTIPLSSITIPANRQRRDFPLDKLNELGESIKTRGLFHPIVVREEGGNVFLVAGERRFRAISDLYELGGAFKHDNISVPAGEVPVVSLGELDELAREEAELDENIRRADLTWQERAAATARLAALRNRQAAAGAAPLPSVASIAEEVRGRSDGAFGADTRKEIVVSKFLNDPEVAAAKSVRDAYKILQRKETAAKDAQLAATVGRTFSSASHTLLNEDSLLWLASTSAEQFDVILTDPPYGMGADEFGDSGGRAAGGHGYQDSVDVFRACLAAAAEHFIRITRPQAHLYWFCDIDKFHESRDAFTAAGWWVHRTPLIWHKMNGSRVPWPEHGPQRKYELILYAVKGKRPVKHIYPDIVSCNTDENLGHAAQKPVTLYNQLLQRSVSPGDRVLDCFGGSGPIIPAAHGLKCSATYIERDQTSYGIALKRLEAATEQLELENLLK